MALRYNRLFVKCEADRMVGVHARTIKENDVRFDWKRFWKYLKPHLLKLIAAIIVSLILYTKNLKKNKNCFFFRQHWQLLTST